MVRADTFTDTDIAVLRQIVLDAMTRRAPNAPSSRWWTKVCGPLIMDAAMARPIVSLHQLVMTLVTYLPVADGEVIAFGAQTGLATLCTTHEQFIDQFVWDLHRRTWSQRPVAFTPASARGEVFVKFGYAMSLPLYCPNFFASSPNVRAVSLAQTIFVLSVVNHDGGDGYANVELSLFTHDSPLSALKQTAGTRRLRAYLNKEQGGVEPMPLAAWFYGLADGSTIANRDVFDSAPRDYATAESDSTIIRGVGRFLAAALIEDIPVSASAHQSIYAAFLNETLRLDDIAVGDPDVYAELTRIVSLAPTELTNVTLNIRTESIAVTVENRESLVKRKIESLAVGPAPDLIRFLIEGFTSVIPLSLMKRRVIPTDLMRMVTGAPSIDIDDLRAHVEIVGFEGGESNKQILWLFNQLTDECDDGMRRSFLRIVTGSTRLPMGGFASLPSRITIIPWAYDDEVDPMGDPRTLTFALPNYANESNQREHVFSAFRIASATNVRAVGRIRPGKPLPSDWATEFVEDIAGSLATDPPNRLAYLGSSWFWSDGLLNRGALLLREAKVRLLSMSDILLPVLALAGSPPLLPTRSVGPSTNPEFTLFCSQYAKRIRAWLIEFQRKWHRGRSLPWQMPTDGPARLLEFARWGFAGYLPSYYPAVFNTAELRGIGLAHRLYRAGLLDTGSAHGLRISSPRGSAMFGASISELLGSDVSVLRRGVEAIVFEGEGGRGPGVVREWFSEMVSEFLNPNRTLLEVSTEPPFSVRLGTGANETYFQNRCQLEALGRFLGLALVQGVQVGLNFPTAFFRRLAGQDIRLTDIQFDEPEWYSSLTNLIGLSRDELEQLELEIPIWGTPVLVTRWNRNTLVQQKLQSLIGPMTGDSMLDKLRIGINSVVDPNHSWHFIGPADIKAILVGSPVIDADDLIDTAVLTGYSKDSPQIVWLRNVIGSFDDEGMRVKFLRFVTGLERLPIGGFRHLPQPLTISAREGTVDALPESATCHYWLKLPRYPSESVLRDKLTTAIFSDPTVDIL